MPLVDVVAAEVENIFDNNVADFSSLEVGEHTMLENKAGKVC